MRGSKAKWWIALDILVLIVAELAGTFDRYAYLRKLHPLETWVYGPKSGQWRWRHPVHTFLFEQEPGAIGRALGMSQSESVNLRDATGPGFVAGNGFTDAAQLPLPSGGIGSLYRSGNSDYPWALEIPTDEPAWALRVWSDAKRWIGLGS